MWPDPNPSLLDESVNYDAFDGLLKVQNKTLESM
jgi:hypothetical protein